MSTGGAKKGNAVSWALWTKMRGKCKKTLAHKNTIDKDLAAVRVSNHTELQAQY
jgi:hypothetical protein